MKWIRAVMVLCLYMTVMPVNAESAAKALKNWYFGGALAYMNFEGHYTNTRLPLLGKQMYFAADSVGGSLLGGYHFNEQWGLEFAIRDSGNVASSNVYHAFFSEMVFTPVYRWQPVSGFSINLRAGLSLASYFVELDRVVPWADNELSWTAIAPVAGIDLEWMVTDHLGITLGFDYVDAHFKPEFDLAYNGSGFYQLPDINAVLGRTALGMRYRF